MNKKGFVDMDVVLSPAFAILTIFAWSATLMGYFWGKNTGMEVFPTYQLILILVIEAGAAYVFAAKD